MAPIQGSTKKSRNKKITLAHHDDAITSAQEICYYVVCTSHGIVMMSQSNFLFLDFLVLP